ncbi:MAG: HlyC/CorC family transporter [Lachnospiraceae bacterium]|nr:HlyC/CorC family transporter [Lachnospiraceae bacterium]
MDSDYPNPQKREKSFFQKIAAFFKKPSEEDQVEEIISMVNESHEAGNLRATEATMIQNIFEFDDKDAKDVMVHRKDIIALDGEATLGDAIKFFNENHFSRIPVYLDDLDNIIGIIHLKDMFALATRTELHHRKVRDLDILRTPEFVPETHGINTLFTQMQYTKNHMIIVVDEYGQTSGLITLEDILEEIVGNIQDEHDDEHEEIAKIEDFYEMDGLVSLEDVGERLGIDFTDMEFETLNGFLIDRYGKIPQEHATFTIDAYGYRFEILDVEGRRITKVRVSSLDEDIEK